MSKKLLSPTHAVVNLSEKEGSLFKKTLICRTGEFMAGTGPILVTKELLQKIADNYNAQRANPQNENDYAPILLDHCRAVDNTKGRLMTGLYVAPWANTETGQEEFGLYGDLRVDDEEAIKKVELGTYSQVSLSFDEDTGEIYEVSFVAVEAARRSQVLSQGEKKMPTPEEFKVVQLSLQKTKSKIKTLKATNKAAALSAQKNVDAAIDEAKKLVELCGKTITAAKTATLSSQFKGFVRQGKMTPAELKELKISELSALPEAAIKHVLSSYEARPVSADVVQHGHSDAKPMELSKLSPAEIRKAAQLQKQGKGIVALAEEDETPEEKKKREEAEKLAEKDGKKEGEKEGGKEYTIEDMAEISRHMGNAHESLGKLNEYMKSMGEMLKKLSESNEDDKQSEEDSE